MVLFGALIDQPFYSRDADVLLNGVGAAVSLLAIPALDRRLLWWGFLVVSLYLVISSYIIMFVRSKPAHAENPTALSVSRINRRIGNPRSLFSVLFLWGVVQQFGINGYSSSALFLYWALFLAFDLTGLSKTLDSILYRDKAAPSTSVGTVSKVIAPGILEVELVCNAALSLGSPVQIGASAEESTAEGVLIEDTPVLGTRIARIILKETKTDWLVKLSEPEVHLCVFGKDGSTKDVLHERFVGIVDSGSDILSIKTSTSPSTSLRQGELLWTWLDGDRRAYYQVVAGKVHESKLADGGTSKLVLAEAQQLGIWDAKRGRFEPITWVAKANSPVYKSLDADLPETKINESERGQVGVIPNSKFPVHVGLQDIVTHNTAILGVTGSGKSWLAFSLIENLIKAKIKVLVLDISRQYWDYLSSHTPVAIKSSAEVAAWIDKQDSYLGIYQFADATGSFPPATAQFVEAAFNKISSTVKLQAGVDVPARLCIVIEEAHSLIPEWNQVSQKGDETQVNKTARILLQGRKFGLGAMVVTQRTANVTKTILNQCNTVFALQSFDQTGLDFLRNYMGESYAQSISTLPIRHCILVGKSSSSTRPVIFEITDLSSKWKKDEAPAADQMTVPTVTKAEAGATNT